MPTPATLEEARALAATDPALAREFDNEIAKEDALASFDAWALRGKQNMTYEARKTPAGYLDAARKSLALRQAIAASPEGKARAAMSLAKARMVEAEEAFLAADAALSRDPAKASKAVFDALAAADAYSAALSVAAARMGML